MDSSTGQARPHDCHRIALAFQGGGALGAYQCGVYQALEEAGLAPDWVAGVSIGAINAALIIGNAPESRLARLKEFWARIADRAQFLHLPEGDSFRRSAGLASAFGTMLQGQPNFFTPNPMNAWFAARGSPSAIAFYDSAPLRKTLTELVDFGLINSRTHRLAVGAVNVESGNFQWFDNQRQDIGVEHIMASGALPPALPAVRVGTDMFWDGGIVSNTPLQQILDDDGGGDTMVFQVDLFPARGSIPRDMQDVLGREKDIRFSSRTRYVTDSYKRLHQWKLRTRKALDLVPEEALDDDMRKLKAQLQELPRLVLFQLIYRQQPWEGQAKDYEFSAASVQHHWTSGLEDTRATLARHEWLRLPAADEGIITHDIHSDAA